MGSLNFAPPPPPLGPLLVPGSILHSVESYLSLVVTLQYLAVVMSYHVGILCPNIGGSKKLGTLP